jgi:hypothetical protein
LSGQTAENATGQPQENVRQLPGFWQEAEDRILSKRLYPNMIIVDKSVDKVFQAPPCEIKEITIDRLLASEHYSRCSVLESDDGLKLLANSIRVFGLRELPRVKPSHRSGYYEVMSGHRRIEAVNKILHWTSINCKVYPSDLDPSWVAFFEGLHNLAPWAKASRPFSMYEMGVFFTKIKGQNENMIDFGLDSHFTNLCLERAELLDGSSQGLSCDEKQAFLANLDTEQVYFLDRLETWEDAQKAAKKIAGGASLKELKELERSSAKERLKLDQKEAAARQDDPTHRPEPQAEAEEEQEGASPDVDAAGTVAALHQQILSLRDEGKSYRQIESKVKLSRSMIGIILKRHSQGTCPSCQKQTSTAESLI